MNTSLDAAATIKDRTSSAALSAASKSSSVVLPSFGRKEAAPMTSVRKCVMAILLPRRASSIALRFLFPLISSSRCCLMALCVGVVGAWLQPSAKTVGDMHEHAMDRTDSREAKTHPSR